jgi:arylsulfatase A-like enzyme
MKALVLTARGLQAGLVAAYGNLWIDTPALDVLASQGVVFDQHFAGRADAAGARREWRDGRYHLPTRGDDADVTRGDDLIAALRARGVFTCLIVDDGRPWPTGFDAGWDEVRRAASFPDAVEAAREALGRLAGRDDWLLWVDLGAPLPPWDAPEEFVALYFQDEPAGEPEDEDDADEGEDIVLEPLQPLTAPAEGPIDVDDDALYFRLQSTYAGAVSYLDSGIGQILDALADLPPGDEPLVLFTTDHGLPLGEHGVVGMARPWPHAEVAHLPLIVRLPGGDEAGRRVDALTQAADLAPTLADVFGVDLPARQGHSLLPLAYGEAERVRDYACSGAADEWALRTPEWAYFLLTDGPRLYVRPDDRREVNNVLQHHLELADGLEKTLRAFAEASRRAGPLQAPPLPNTG